MRICPTIVLWHALMSLFWPGSLGVVLAAPPNAGGTIAGRVVASDTDKPLPKASVRLMFTEQGTLSDSAGAFVLDHVPAGTHTVTVEYVGYDSATRRNIQVTPGGITDVEFRLRTSPIRSTDITVL